LDINVEEKEIINQKEKVKELELFSRNLQDIAENLKNKWLIPLILAINKLSKYFSEYMLSIHCSGEIKLGSNSSYYYFLIEKRYVES
jgi:hypothetical protein